MGQVPKKIIYAAQGIKFDINSKDVDIAENQMDAFAGEIVDNLVASGELRGDEREDFMKNSYGKFKDLARKGTYSIGTAGPNNISHLQYQGEASNEDLGLDEGGESARRSRVARKFTSKLTPAVGSPKTANWMSRLNKEMALKLGQYATQMEAESVKKAELADHEAALKLKEEELKRTTLPQLDASFSEYYGGRPLSEYNESMGALAPEAKQQLALKHINNVIANQTNYTALKGKPADWVTRYMDPTTGAFNPSTENIKNFYSDVYGNEGLKFATNNILGEKAPVTPDITVTPEQAVQIEDTKKWAAADAQSQLDEEWNDFMSKSGAIEQHASGLVRSKGATRLTGADSSKFRVWGDPKTKTFFYTKINPAEQYLPNQAPAERFELVERNGKTYMVSKATKSKKEQIIEVKDKFTPVKALGGIILAQDGTTVKRTHASYLISPEDTIRPPAAKPGTTTGPVKDKTAAKPGEQTKPEEPTEEDLSDADDFDSMALKADIGALLVQLGGAAAAVPTGGSTLVGGQIGGAIAGLAGTGLSATANAKRHMPGWKNTLYTGAGVLGDVATLIPGVGAWMSGLKIAGGLKKYSKLLKVAGVGSVGMGVSTLVQDYAEGKKELKDFSTDDWRMIVNGLSLVHAGKLANKVNKATDIEPVNNKITGKIIEKGKTSPLPGEVELHQPVRGLNDPWVPTDAVKYPSSNFEAVKENSLLGSFGPKIVPGSLETVVKPTIPFRPVINGERQGVLQSLWKSGPGGSASTEGLKAPLEKGFGWRRATAPTVAAPAVKPVASAVPPVTPPVVAPPVPPVVAPPKAPKKPRAKKTVPKGEWGIKMPGTPTGITSLADTLKNITNPGNIKLQSIPNILNKTAAYGGTNFTSQPTTGVTPLTDTLKNSINPTDQFNLQPKQFRTGSVSGSTGVTSLVNTIKSATNPGDNTKVNPGSIIFDRPEANGAIKLTPKTITGVTSLEETLKQVTNPTGKFNIQGKEAPKIVDVGLNNKATPMKPGFNMSPDRMNQLTDLTRMLLLNKTANNQNKRINPTILPPAAELSIPVAGDNLTQQSAYNRATALRKTGTQNLTSDATQNANIRRSVEGAAQDVERQGDMNFAAGLDKSKQLNLNNAANNIQTRTRIAGANLDSLNRAHEQMRQEENATKNQVASNVDSFLGAQVAENKLRMREKEGAQQSLQEKVWRREFENHPNAKPVYDAYYAAQTSGKPMDPALTAKFNALNAEYLNIMGKSRGLSPVQPFDASSLDNFKFAHGGILAKDILRFKFDMFKENQRENNLAAKLVNDWIQDKVKVSVQNAAAYTKKLNK